MASSTTQKYRSLVGDPADAGSAGHDVHAHGAHKSHAVPLHILFGVYVALLVCTFLTVAVTYFEFGIMNVWVALIIAVIKATLVAMYFMHLRWDKPFNGLILVVALFFVALFIGWVVLDTKEYNVNFTPPPNTASPS